jgi:DNA-binding transcriptional ArsR family regulator
MPPRRRKPRLGRLAAARRRDLFFVLGEPTRRRLIELIAREEQPLARLVRFFPSTRQAVYDHLSILRQAGLVSARLAGNRHYYRLRSARLREIRSWLARYERLWRRERRSSDARARSKIRT